MRLSYSKAYFKNIFGILSKDSLSTMLILHPCRRNRDGPTVVITLVSLWCGLGSTPAHGAWLSKRLVSLPAWSNILKSNSRAWEHTSYFENRFSLFCFLIFQSLRFKTFKLQSWNTINLMLKTNNLNKAWCIAGWTLMGFKFLFFL